MGPEIFGVANVEFYVVYSAAQFLSREYVRKSSIIFTKNCNLSQRAMEREIFSLGWCVVSLSFVISALIYLLSPSAPSTSTRSVYSRGIWLCTAAGLIEMFAEPFILIATVRVWSRTVSSIEAAGSFLKLILSLLSIRLFVSDSNDAVIDTDGYLLCFAYSQLAASCIVVLLWIAMFVQMVRNKTDHQQSSGFMSLGDLVPSVHRVDGTLLSSSAMFFFQSVVKFGLTEGEKLVMMGLQIDATRLLCAAAPAAVPIPLSAHCTLDYRQI